MMRANGRFLGSFVVLASMLSLLSCCADPSPSSSGSSQTSGSSLSSSPSSSASDPAGGYLWKSNSFLPACRMAQSLYNAALTDGCGLSPIEGEAIADEGGYYLPMSRPDYIGYKTNDFGSYTNVKVYDSLAFRMHFAEGQLFCPNRAFEGHDVDVILSLYELVDGLGARRDPDGLAVSAVFSYDGHFAILTGDASVVASRSWVGVNYSIFTLTAGHAYGFSESGVYTSSLEEVAEIMVRPSSVSFDVFGVDYSTEDGDAVNYVSFSYVDKGAYRRLGEGSTFALPSSDGAFADLAGTVAGTEEHEYGGTVVTAVKVLTDQGDFDVYDPDPAFVHGGSPAGAPSSIAAGSKVTFPYFSFFDVAPKIIVVPSGTATFEV